MSIATAHRDDASGPARSSPGLTHGGWITRADLVFLAALFVIGRALVAVVAILGADQVPVAQGASFAQILCTWDCNWYVELAESGYSAPADVDASGAANWAFFPALPLMIRALTATTGLEAVDAGLILATLLYAAGLVLFFLYAGDLYGRRFARFAAVVFAAWPFAIHASVPMSEAVFVPMSLAALLAARRGAWITAGLAAAVLGGTRAVGVLVFLPLVMLAARQYGLGRLLALRPGTERAALALALSGVGLGLFMLYLHGHVGDALAFSHDQIAWNRRFLWPWMMIIDELHPSTRSVDAIFANGAILATLAAGLAAAVVAWRRGLRPEAIFVAAPLVVALHSGSPMSMPRFVGGLFPIVLVLALVADRPRWRVAVVVVSLLLQAAAVVDWVREQAYVM